jgi:hypothetical protein
VYVPRHVILVLLDLITWMVLGTKYKSLSSSLCNFLQSRYLIPLRTKYLSRHHILEHPVCTLPPLCEMDFHTHVKWYTKL